MTWLNNSCEKNRTLDKNSNLKALRNRLIHVTSRRRFLNTHYKKNELVASIKNKVDLSEDQLNSMSKKRIIDLITDKEGLQ